EIAEFFDRLARHAKDGGEVVSRVRERDRRIRALLLQRLVENDFGFGHQRVRAAHGSGGNVFRHVCLHERGKKKDNNASFLFLFSFVNPPPNRKWLRVSFPAAAPPTRAFANRRCARTYPSPTRADRARRASCQCVRESPQSSFAGRG